MTLLQKAATPRLPEHEYEGGVARIFNASNEFIEAMFDGVMYQLAPNGWAFNLRTRQDEEHDGVTEIRDAYGPKLTTNGEGETVILHNQLLHDAEKIAKHIVGSWERRGVVKLTGTKDVDESKKRRASERWNGHQMVVCNEILSARADELSIFHKNNLNRDRVPPPPSPLVRMATEFLQRAQAKGLQRKAFVCVQCGYDTDKTGSFLQHCETFPGCRDAMAREGVIAVAPDGAITLLKDKAAKAADPLQARQEIEPSSPPQELAQVFGNDDEGAGGAVVDPDVEVVARQTGGIGRRARPEEAPATP